MKIKVGLIGFGRMGQFYLKEMQKSGFTEKLKKKLSGNKRRFLLSGNYFWRYAAVAVFTIGIAIGLIERPWEDRSSEMSPMAQQPAVLPGSYKAVLTLASGEQVNLEEWGRDSLWKDGTLIRKRKGELTYEQKAGDMQQEEMLFNTITIPRSGEYKLVLSDGTKVWLNSASKLKYPVAFTGGQRKVFLEGEAYFKVAKNEKQPFVVKTENMDVRVLGTEFNLKAYADEKWVQATLVRGEVAVFTGMDKSVRNTLKPEQQAEWDIEKGKLDVKTVELDLYIAWKNGQFVFRGQRLTEIMTVLERWYDFEVCYQADWIKEVEFAGKLNRSASIEPILDVIRSTHKINVNTRGKTIVFSAKQ